MKEGYKIGMGDGKTEKMNSRSKTENIGAALVHEGTHSVEKPSKDNEKEPIENAAKYIQELRSKKEQ